MNRKDEVALFESLASDMICPANDNADEVVRYEFRQSTKFVYEKDLRDGGIGFCIDGCHVAGSYRMTVALALFIEHMKSVQCRLKIVFDSIKSFSLDELNNIVGLNVISRSLGKTNDLYWDLTNMIENLSKVQDEMTRRQHRIDSEKNGEECDE